MKNNNSRFFGTVTNIYKQLGVRKCPYCKEKLVKNDTIGIVIIVII